MALVVVLTVVVLLLAVLVAGLLRSHADILRALHSLGAGVGDPAVTGPTGAGPAGAGPAGTGPAGGDRAVPVTMGPTLPSERSTSATATVAGVTPAGDGLAVAVGTNGRLTLLAFLSSGCSSCQGFWQGFAGGPGQAALPPGVDLLVVTKGPELEIRGEVAAKAAAAPGTAVVMSTEAWTDYEVPGSPFFVLVDGARGRRIGEGIANTFGQVVDLVRRAQLERDADDGQGGAGQDGAEGGGPGGAGHGGAAAGGSPGAGRRGPDRGTGGDGPTRERANDRALRAAGILPGDPSLYPASLDDLYGVGRVAANPGR
ncbi:MAG TPA: hypothetical protein VHB02_19180 [Acidimicrobiales bacterium]|nr:hypothetical protein [Acidimicrobiales bacterium]